MVTITEIVMEKIEETRKRFYRECGKHHTDEKKAFINWYVKTHPAPLEVLLLDLSEYYLHISQATIMTYLNEAE